jgi:ankyrin repeat protein
MKSTKFQLLVTLVAILTAAAIFAAKGPPPELNILVAADSEDLVQVQRAVAWGCPIDQQDMYGFTPLMRATHGREVAEFLIAHGADVRVRDHEGGTPLHWTTGYGQREIMELLIAQGADVNAKDKRGRTPLHREVPFIIEGRKGRTEVLIAHGADVNAKDNLGRTPLHVAAEVGRKYGAGAELLIAHGAKVNAKDKEGRTPLHWAASSRLVEGYTEVSRILLAHGAEIDAKDNDGQTPLQLAIKAGHKEEAELLRQHGAKE